MALAEAQPTTHIQTLRPPHSCCDQPPEAEVREKGGHWSQLTLQHNSPSPYLSFHTGMYAAVVFPVPSAHTTALLILLSPSTSLQLSHSTSRPQTPAQQKHCKYRFPGRAGKDHSPRTKTPTEPAFLLAPNTFFHCQPGIHPRTVGGNQLTGLQAS